MPTMYQLLCLPCTSYCAYTATVPVIMPTLYQILCPHFTSYYVSFINEVQAY